MQPISLQFYRLRDWSKNDLPWCHQGGRPDGLLRWRACAADMLQAACDSYDWLTREGLARGRRQA